MGFPKSPVGVVLALITLTTGCNDTGDILADGELTDGELGHAIANVISCAADEGVLVVPVIDEQASGVSFRVAADSQGVLDDCYEEHFREISLFQADNP